MNVKGKNIRKCEEKKVGVAVLHSTRYDNSKGTRIGPSLFYASDLHCKYNKKEQVLKPPQL